MKPMIEWLGTAGVNKGVTYFLFWGGFATISLSSFWLAVYLILQAIKNHKC